DLAARFRHAVDPAERAPSDEIPDQERAETHHAQSHRKGTAHHATELLRLAQISSDETNHLVRPTYHLSNSRMTTPPAPCPLFTKTPIKEGTLRPTGSIEHTGLNAFDIAGEDKAAGIRNEVEICAWLPGTNFDQPNQAGQPGALVGTREAGDLFCDCLLRLADQHARGKRAHIDDEHHRASGKQHEIKRGESCRSGLHDGRKGGHQSARIM